MMPTELPKHLAYLAPVIAQLSSVDPENLNEDNIEAADAVERAVRGRIKGLDAEQAQTTVQEDSAALKEWLAQPELARSPGQYMFGLMLVCPGGAISTRSPAMHRNVGPFKPQKV